MSLFGRSLEDGDRLEVAGAVVRLKVHNRARRVSLRLDRTRREIIATAPSLRRLPEAAAFARDRAAWIADRLAELPDAEAVAPGVVITLFGQPCRLEASDKPQIQINTETMAKFRPEMAKYYYDSKKYPTYLDQLGIKWPPAQLTPPAQPKSE
ncbi:MAG TPA: DUF45 domain-containing protein [Phenylobacterium sp.]|nr:DUF45 domain-containing protein [Phenylobacterium sp.]